MRHSPPWTPAHRAGFVRSRIDQFWARVDRSAGVDACWRWTGPLDRLGYGHVGVWGRGHRAHHAAYLFAGFPIPPHFHVDHLCRNPACCNPRHLEAVPPGENIRRSPLMQFNGAHERAKTHCPQGHPYSGDNLYRRPDGGRDCRICQRERDRASLERRRARLTNTPVVAEQGG